MSLKEEITVDMKQALKNGKKEELSAIRMLLAEVKNAEIEKGDELKDEDLIQVIARQVKKWEQAAEEYEKAGKKEQADKERRDAETLKKYLPEQMSEEEISKVVEETIAEVNPEGMKDMGKVMGAIMPKVKGKADGSRVNMLVKEKLQEM